MIHIRKRKLFLFALCSYLLIDDVRPQSNSRAYDTSEWIPIMPDASEIVERKTAGDRVLNLDAPVQQFNFQEEDHEYRKRRPNQVPQFANGAPAKKELFDRPKARKLKHPSEYKFETPPPPPTRTQPQINYYNGESLAPFVFEQVPVPSVNPQAPEPNAPSLYEQYQLPFNASFYESLNPSSINNEFYQAITNDTENFQQQRKPPASKPSIEQERVQLVYVPVENLKASQQSYQNSKPLYQQTETTQNVNSYIQGGLQQESQHQVPVTPKTLKFHENHEPKQVRLQNIEQDFIQRAVQAHRLQQQLRDDINPLKQETITTEKPKRKPHQPPLAVFVESHGKAEIRDVLNMLKGANTIAVQDKVTPDSPRIFIGPSNLNSPEGYTKFPLPYLNNINGNRIERKIDQLPFFVAPVSYKTPPGYAKITLPSPHVGSVVVSVPVAASTTAEPLLFNQNYHSYLVGNSYGDEATVAPPARGVYENTFTPTPLDVYYTPQQSFDEQTSYQTRLPQQQVYQEQPSSTIRPKYDSGEQQLHLPEVNPLESAINEFEQQQITDGQYEEHNKVKHSTTRRPQSVYNERPTTPTARSRGRPIYEEEPTTPRGRARGRGRNGGTSRTTTTTTTTASVEAEKYTVLEEFAVRQPPRTPPTENFGHTTIGTETESPRRPSNSFRGNPYLPEENLENTRPKAFDYSLSQIQFEPPKTKFEEAEQGTRNDKNINSFTSVENIPANVYTLGQRQIYDFDTSSASPQPATGLVYENIEQSGLSPTEQPTTPSHVHRFSPDFVSYENREPNQRRPNDDDGSGEEPNRQQSAEVPSGYLENLFRPNFDQTYISLQDQAVRSLLSPNLLAPTTRQDSSSTNTIVGASTEPFVDEVPSSSTTEAETTSTTTRAPRTRGRGRARITTTSASPARRPPSRRRPISRTTTEKISSTTAYSYEDNGEFKRSRTRARISTTEDAEPTNNQLAEQNNQEIPQSYMQFEHSIDREQVVTIIPDQERQIDVYNVPSQTPPENQQGTFDYDNANVVQPKPTTPVKLNNANIRSGGVLINNKPESTTRTTTTKPRGRTKGRSRFATSTTTTARPVTRISTRPTTAPAKATTEKQEQEFYGFIGQPNLNIQAQKSIPSSEEQPVQFLGEIRPKYSLRTTTVQPSEDLVDNVGSPKPRIRGRTRAPVRKTTESDNVDVRYTARGSEQVTRRSSGRTRSRGSAHYRVPENVKRESDEEDFAGQNYPANFLQKLDVSSPGPNFQITLDPLDEEAVGDDQSPHSSLYRPEIVPKPDNWGEPNALPSDGGKDASLSSSLSSFKYETTTETISEPLAHALVLTQAAQPEQNFFPGNQMDTIMVDLEKIQTSPTEGAPKAQLATKAQANRRKGAWKLVKQRPVDPLEVSESQNYQTVLNAFGAIEKIGPYSKGGTHGHEFPNYFSGTLSLPEEDDDDNSNNSDVAVGAEEYDIGKTSTVLAITTEAVTELNTEEVPTTTPPPTKNQENIFDAIYEMFGIFEKQDNTTDTISSTTTVVNPTTTTRMNLELTEMNDDNLETTIKPSTRPYEIEPWEMKEVKTSTSTEISHETEICYKGRCVKSRDKKRHK